MPNLKNDLPLIDPEKYQKHFPLLYGEDNDTLLYQTSRYERIIQKFQSYFPSGKIHVFSSPGRTELAGNHTDHNQGRVLAGSVNLDSIAAASKVQEPKVTVRSEGYPDIYEVDLSDLRPKAHEQRTTPAVIRGIAARLQERGYAVGGFNAYISSDVLVGSGLSSSASIEVLIGKIFSTFYNKDLIAPGELAKTGQFAENIYFNKPCGLMDQLACAMGGIIFIDFADSQKPRIKRIDLDFRQHGYGLLVVDTGGSHADLTDDYAAIPEEMKALAEAFGAKVLRDIKKAAVIERTPQLRSAVGDRAILRAMHFFAENERVHNQVKALEKGDIKTFLKLISESGISSSRWLQNSYSPKQPGDQGISLALALTEDYLSTIASGACRVHGGGFAGTIQVFMPVAAIEDYKNLMTPIFGAESIYLLAIRPLGALCLNALVT